MEILSNPGKCVLQSKLDARVRKRRKLRDFEEEVASQR